MSQGLRVPTHRVDAPGVLILPHDDAWDHARIEAEQDELEAAALREVRTEAARKYAGDRGVEVSSLTPEQVAEVDESCALTEDERDAARATHPVARYLRGETRYQPDAPDQGPRGPACALDYLRPDATPWRHHLRRIPWRERARIELEQDHITRFERYVRAGLAGVDAGDLQWRADAPTDRVPDRVLDEVMEGPGGASANLISLAAACKKYSDPPTEAEGKH